MASPTGRCPFLIDIDGRIEIAAVYSPALWTGPDAIPERDGVVDMPTDMTPLGRWKPPGNTLDDNARGACHMMQDGHERGKPQVRDLAAHRVFMPLMLSVSRRMMSYCVQRSWASFQWKACRT